MKNWLRAENRGKQKTVLQELILIIVFCLSVPALCNAQFKFANFKSPHLPPGVDEWTLGGDTGSGEPENESEYGRQKTFENPQSEKPDRADSQRKNKNKINYQPVTVRLDRRLDNNSAQQVRRNPGNDGQPIKWKGGDGLDTTNEAISLNQADSADPSGALFHSADYLAMDTVRENLPTQTQRNIVPEFGFVLSPWAMFRLTSIDNSLPGPGRVGNQSTR